VHGKKIGNQWILLIDVLKIRKSFGGYPFILTASKTATIETNIIRNRILKTVNIFLTKIKIQIFINGNLFLFVNSEIDGFY